MPQIGRFVVRTPCFVFYIHKLCTISSFDVIIYLEDRGRLAPTLLKVGTPTARHVGAQYGVCLYFKKQTRRKVLS